MRPQLDGLLDIRGAGWSSDEVDRPRQGGHLLPHSLEDVFHMPDEVLFAKQHHMVFGKEVQGGRRGFRREQNQSSGFRDAAIGRGQAYQPIPKIRADIDTNIVPGQGGPVLVDRGQQLPFEAMLI